MAKSGVIPDNSPQSDRLLAHTSHGGGTDSCNMIGLSDLQFACEKQSVPKCFLAQSCFGFSSKTP